MKIHDYELQRETDLPRDFNYISYVQLHTLARDRGLESRAGIAWRTYGDALQQNIHLSIYRAGDSIVLAKEPDLEDMNLPSLHVLYRESDTMALW